jgi:hypothetical protein
MIPSLNSGVRVMLYSNKLGNSCSEPCDSARCNYIYLSQMVVYFHLIILDQLEPSSLSHVQVRLCEYVRQAFVVRIDVNHIPKQVMSPCSQC